MSQLMEPHHGPNLLPQTTGQPSLNSCLFQGRDDEACSKDMGITVDFSQRDIIIHELQKAFQEGDVLPVPRFICFQVGGELHDDYYDDEITVFSFSSQQDEQQEPVEYVIRDVPNLRVTCLHEEFAVEKESTSSMSSDEDIFVSSEDITVSTKSNLAEAIQPDSFQKCKKKTSWLKKVPLRLKYFLGGDDSENELALHDFFGLDHTTSYAKALDGTSAHTNAILRCYR
jgi:hypothetical protein